LQDGVVSIAPGKLGPVSRLAAEVQRFLEVDRGVGELAHSMGEEAQQTIEADQTVGIQCAPKGL